jgi:hypothetical protein
MCQWYLESDSESRSTRVWLRLDLCLGVEAGDHDDVDSGLERNRFSVDGRVYYEIRTVSERGQVSVSV